MAHRTGRSRRALVEDAGLPTTSAVSIVAGTLVAFGALAVVAAIAGAVGNAFGVSTDGVSTSEWRSAGIVAAVAATVVVFAAFFFGGYTAGRMSRRAGARHGLAVFAVAVIVGAVIIGLTAWEGGASELRDNLNSNGVPTDADTWSGIAVGAVVAGAVAMLLGAVLGGLRGERWHGRIEEAAIETRRPEAIDLTAPEHQPSVEDEREQQRQLRDREAGRADQAPTAF